VAQITQLLLVLAVLVLLLQAVLGLMPQMVKTRYLVQLLHLAEGSVELVLEWGLIRKMVVLVVLVVEVLDTIQELLEAVMQRKVLRVVLAQQIHFLVLEVEVELVQRELPQRVTLAELVAQV
jgi:hypothetical protein